MGATRMMPKLPKMNNSFLNMYWASLCSFSGVPTPTFFQGAYPYLLELGFVQTGGRCGPIRTIRIAISM